MPRGRRLFTRDQAEAALLSAGIDILTESGASYGVSRATLAAAIERSGVPRPSAYRVYNSERTGGPLGGFHEALAIELAKRVGEVESRAVVASAEAIVAEATQVADTATSLELAALLREAIRVGGAVVSRGVFQHEQGATYLTALAAAQHSRASEAVRAAFVASERELHQAYVLLYDRIMRVFGLRIGPGWTLDRLVAAVSDSSLGYSIAGDVVPGHEPFDLPTGENGEMQQWSTTAWTIWNMFSLAMEPDPRVSNAADISLLPAI